jgi:Uma2 family endonuclease
MSTAESIIGTRLTPWEEFLELPDAEDRSHYELPDGEVAVVPPSGPIHIYIQYFLARWLTAAAEGRGGAMAEFPYRPAPNLQFWYADVAYLPNEDWQAMRRLDYLVYVPPLVIEVLSSSNRALKIGRQRIAAFSGGTQEFWVVDPDRKTVEVSLPGLPSRIYGADDRLPVNVLQGATFPVTDVFRD